MQEVYVSYPELRQLGIPFCRLHVNRLTKAGRFPEAVWFGNNRKLWRLSDIERWLASRPTKRPAASKEPADAA
jgi:predicted DNA-binding transcriptional regulator AlpA